MNLQESVTVDASSGNLHSLLTAYLYGREGSASDRVGINPAEGRPLSSRHGLHERLLEVIYNFLRLFFPVLPEIPPLS